MEKLRMSIGVDDFGKLRTNNFYYVDKSGMIKELLDYWGEVNLFTRPRRFGKSMNMSMLTEEYQALRNRDLFKAVQGFDGVKQISPGRQSSASCI